jgi:hypothetical protein
MSKQFNENNIFIGFSYTTLSTGGVRDENTTEWYWESSGNVIKDEDFHWDIN